MKRQKKKTWTKTSSTLLRYRQTPMLSYTSKSPRASTWALSNLLLTASSILPIFRSKNKANASVSIVFILFLSHRHYGVIGFDMIWFFLHTISVCKNKEYFWYCKIIGGNLIYSLFSTDSKLEYVVNRLYKTWKKFFARKTSLPHFFG